MRGGERMIQSELRMQREVQDIFPDAAIEKAVEDVWKHIDGMTIKQAEMVLEKVFERMGGVTCHF